MSVSAVPGWNMKTSQELHVCLLPLQHDRALISFSFSCCSTFFSTWDGLFFFCPRSSRCRKRYLTSSNPLLLQMSGEMRKAELLSHHGSPMSFTHMRLRRGSELRHSLITETDVGCFSALSRMSTRHRTFLRSKQDVGLLTAGKLFSGAHSRSACLASNIQMMTRH